MAGRDGDVRQGMVESLLADMTQTAARLDERSAIVRYRAARAESSGRVRPDPVAQPPAWLMNLDQPGATAGRLWPALIRQLRERHFLSQEGMAERLQVDRTTIARWEAGRNRPQPSQVRRICHTFAVSADQLSLVDSEVMKRRDFNRGLVGLGVTALVGSFDQSVGPAASSIGDVQAGCSPAEHFLLIRKTLADNDNLLGPRLVIPTAIDQVRAIQRARQRVDGTDLRELVHVQAQFADLLGWLHQDSGDFQASQYWMDRALDWAHQTGDRDSVVFVLARKSQLAGDMRDAAEAVDVAEAATRLAGPQNRLGAVAATYAAHGYALRGDHLGCERSYASARSLLDQAEHDDSPWARFFDAAYIGVQRARSLATLGDHREAVDGFRSAIEDLQPGYHRDRGVYLSREAMAHAGLGEIDHAAELGLRAFVIGAETGSERILTELFALNDLLSRWRTNPTMARFNEALATVGRRR